MIPTGIPALAKVSTVISRFFALAVRGSITLLRSSFSVVIEIWTWTDRLLQGRTVYRGRAEPDYF